MKKAMNENEIEAPQLLNGINIEDDGADDDWKPKTRTDKIKLAEQNIMTDKFSDQRQQDKQTLYREREV